MRVAVIQFRPTFKDKLGNLRKLAALIKQASEGGAQLAVCPELCTTGYSLMNDAEARELAEPIHPDTPTFKSMRVLAETFRVYIAWGMVELDAGSGDLFNSQVLVSPDGTWVSYRKINRFGNDYLWARPGRGNPPIMKAFFELPNGGGLVEKKVGLLVCRDVRDKKDDNWSSFYEKGDADICLLSAAWGDGGFPSVTWMDFVENNKVTLAVSNVWGQEENNDFGEGGSCIIEPPDKIHCEGLVWNADCIVYADLEA